MTANKINVEMAFRNYKLIKDADFKMNGSYIYFIIASNNRGKTSLKNAISSCMTAKNTTDEPVTRGEKSGNVSMTLPGADGLMYVVDWNFTNEKSSFTLTKPDGTKVSSVNEIRNIFKYTPFSATEFLSWSLSAEGIRKQVKILLSLLPKAEQDKYELLTIEEANAFDERKDQKKKVDLLLSQAKPVSPEDLALIKNEVAATERIASLEQQLKDINVKHRRSIILKQAIEKIDSLLELCQEDKDLLSKDSTVALNVDRKAISYVIDNAPVDYEVEVDKVDNALTVGRDYLNKVNAAKLLNEQSQTQSKTIQAEQKKLAEIEKRLESKRAEKKKILTDAKLPFDLSIDDDGITVDGFAFKESQICRSASIKVVAALMCKINPSPILILDSVGELDNNSLKELAALAEESGKIMVFDEVLRNETELQIVGYDEI